MKRRIYFLCFTCAFLFFHSCVTTKRKDDLSPIGKLYHNTTAKYNGYFNANEILIATTQILEQQHKDNYQQQLAMFPYMTVANPKAAAPDLDKAIEKVAKVVALHPRSQWTDDCYLLVGKAQFLKQDFEASEETFRFMMDEFNPDKPATSKSKISVQAANSSKTRAAEAAAKAKEREKVKKERQQVAKAKQKERIKAAKEAARKKKQYNREVKKRKKKGLPAPKPAPKPGAPNPEGNQAPADQDKLKAEAKKKAKEEEAKQKAEAKAKEPENSFLKHRPVYQDGVLWLARTLIERDNEESALRLLSKLQQDPKTFSEIRAQIWPVIAHLYLKRGQADEAIMPLEQAVASSGSRQEKARYAFILAQLHQDAGRWQQAGQAFREVLSLSSSFDMEFRAQLNLALNNYRSGSSSAADVRQQLEKMASEDKNAGYRDQIYFTLATMALEGKDRQGAIENLQLSLQSSTNNPLQKAEAYYTLAQLYLEDEVFISAKNYLDSTLMSMPPQDARVVEVKKLRDNITDIAANLITIQEQDSLLKISYLSEDEKRDLASRIKKAEDEKRLAAIAAKETPAPGLPVSARREIGAQAPGQAELESTFFAYNDRSLKRGERDFTDKWGNRPLEDDWRRSNRRSSSEIAEQTQTQETQSGKSSLLLSPEEIDQILANVPKNEAERRMAEFKIAEAMYKLGILYREKLENNQKSAEILEQLVQRFARNNYELDSWFYLYLAYTDLGDAINAKKYADLLVDKYPASKYAQAILNPNSLNEIVGKETEINRYYDQAYSAFQARNYEEAYKMCTESRARFGIDNPLLARFSLLAAFCVGNLEGKEAYLRALSEVVAKFPDTEEQKQAREILRILGGASASLPGGQKQDVSDTGEQGAFSVEDDQLHYILVVGDSLMNINDAKNSISDYNRKYHKLDKLSLTNMFVGPDEQTRVPILIIRRFNNRADAMKFYSGAMANRDEFVKGGNYEVFSISLNNYRELIRLQSIEAYRKFFNANYK